MKKGNLFILHLRDFALLALTEDVWKNAMIEELNSINRNNTWELIELPASKKPIDVKRIFKLKLKPNGEVAKHKARLVARGFMQKAGMDYFEVYAPIVRLETVRLIVTIACGRNWPMHHLDVKSAFLNCPLDEEVYVTHPLGFKIKGKENMMYRLHKALYILKQAPRAWNKRINTSCEARICQMHV
jgi:hypothetical protein